MPSTDAAAHETGDAASPTTASAKVIGLDGLGELRIGRPGARGGSWSEQGVRTSDACRTVSSPDCPGVYAIVPEGNRPVNAKVEIEQAEERLRRAMLSSDVGTLAELLGEHAIFTNQVGARLSKADDIAAHQSGLLRIKQLDIRGEPIIRLLGDSAIVCVTVDLAGAYDGQPFGGAFAYSRIWHRSGDQWQIEAAHCSPAGNV